MDITLKDTYGIELAGNWKNFMVEAEYLRIDVDREDLEQLFLQPPARVALTVEALGLPRADDDHRRPVRVVDVRPDHVHQAAELVEERRRDWGVAAGDRDHVDDVLDAGDADDDDE